MNKSSLPTRLQQTHIQHFQIAQSVIDGLVSAKNTFQNELFSEYHKCGVYDLDSNKKFILGDDVHEARIFPRTQGKKVQELLDTSRLNEQFELLVNRIFEIIKVLSKFLLALLVRLDVTCEKVIVKINELSSTKLYQNTQPSEPIFSEKSLQKNIKIIEKKQKIVTVASTTLDEYAEESCVYVPVQTVQVVEVQKSEKTKQVNGQNTFVQVIRILYMQLRHGTTKDIDSI